MKENLFRAGALLLPVVLVLLVEGVLRLAGVEAAARTVFVPVPGQPDQVALNPDYVARYFDGFVPGIAFQPFQPAKPDGVFRVVALGGSSTAGFPYQFYYGFPARLQERLEAAVPTLRPEVINLGMTAVNSYTLWDLREAVVALEPDAVVLYAGHNEYYGAFGVGSAFNGFTDAVWLKRLVLWFKRTALGALFDGWLRPEAPPPETRTLMARAVGDAAIAQNGETFEAGIAQFEANLEDLLRAFTEAGIPTYLGTLTSNLQDQPPLGEDPEAHAAFTEGQRLLTAGDTAAARTAFLAAKEADEIRFRAPERMNEAIRGFWRLQGVHGVAVAHAFAAASPAGIEADVLFDDHLHPNAAGFDLMAAAFFEAMQPHHPALQEIDWPEMPSLAAVDPIEQAYVAFQLQQLKGGYPFDKVTPPAEAARALQQRLQAIQAQGTTLDSLAAVAFRQQRPMVTTLQAALAHTHATQDTLATLRLFYPLLHWQPFNTALMERAVGYGLATPAYDEALLPLARHAANRTDSVFFHSALAAIHLRQGHLARAGHLLDYVETRTPDDAVMLYNQGRRWLQQGDTAQARTYFQRYQAAR